MSSFLPDFSALDEKSRKIRLLKRLLIIIAIVNFPSAINMSIGLNPVQVAAGVGSELLIFILYYFLIRGKLNGVILFIALVQWPVIGLSPLYLGDSYSTNVSAIAIFLVIIYNATQNRVRVLGGIATFLAIVTARLVIEYNQSVPLESPLIQDLITIFVALAMIFTTLIYYHSDLLNYKTDLQKSYQFLQYLSDVNPHFIFAKDQSRRFVYANKASSELFGRNREEFLGRSDAQLETFQGDHDPYEEDDFKVLREGQTLYIDRETNFDIHGNQRWLSVVKTPIFDAKGNIEGLFGVATNITQMVQFQEELEKSETRYKNIFQTSPVGLAIHNGGKLQYTNQALAEITGYSTEELPEIPLDQLTDAQTIQEIRDFYKQDPSSRTQIFDQEIAIRHKDGQTKFVQIRIAPLFDPQGGFIEDLVSVSDITEIKRRDQILESSLSQLEVTFESITEGVCVTDLTGNLLRYNQKYGEILKLSPELIHGSLEDRIKRGTASRTKDPAAYVKRLIEIVSQPDKPSQDVLHFKDGKIVERHSFPMKVGDKIAGRVWSFRDITRQETFSRILQESEERYRILFEQTPIGLILVDTEVSKAGLQCNQQMQDMFKYTEAELIKGNMLHFSPYHQADGSISKEKFSQLMKTYRKNFQKIHFEWRFLTGEGKFLDCDVTYVPIKIKGQVLTVVMIQDITERRSQQETIQQQLTDLNRQNEQLTEFSYIISHNFRSSVANIQGLAENFDTSDASIETNEEIISMLSQMANRLDHSIQDLHQILDVQRMELEDFELVNLPALLQEVLEELSPQIEFSGADIQMELNPDANIKGLRPYMHSILHNLISNALKYRHPDRDPLIKISSVIRNDQVEIRVADNGLGINMEKYGHKLFSLYARFHDHVEGKGLGLYLVKAQTEAMEGKIQIESEVNIGTTFHLSFKQPIAAGEQIS